MRILICSALLAAIFAIPAQARTMECVRGSVKYFDKPATVTITCDAPKRVARKVKAAAR